jgi:HEAT repeat protein
MRKSIFVHLACAFFLAGLLIASLVSSAFGQALFGPKQFDVRERFGLDNRYTETFGATEGLYLIKVQNGTKPFERVDVMGLSINNKSVLRVKPYEFGFIACFVNLRTQNTIELLIKDAEPTGFRRPTPMPKNVIVTVLPVKALLSSPVALGLGSWEELDASLELLRSLRTKESFNLALQAADVGQDAATRSEALRRLADRRDPQAQPFFLHALNDRADNGDVRAEAALALGYLKDKAAIPSLIQGMMDPGDQVRTGSVRALSLYPEDDVRGPLFQALDSMDAIMRSAAGNAMLSAGWRPIGLFLELADSSDPKTADFGVELLVGVRDERVIRKLLTYLENPGPRDIRTVILALGDSNSPLAVDALLNYAADPARKKNGAPEIAAALAALGDSRATATIEEMIRTAETPQLRAFFVRAYKKLTNKDYPEQTKQDKRQ